MRHLTVASILLAAVALPAAAQSSDFRWHGRLAPGKRIEFPMTRVSCDRGPK